MQHIVYAGFNACLKFLQIWAEILIKIIMFATSYTFLVSYNLYPAAFRSQYPSQKRIQQPVYI
jgi:hypothetical protein